MKCYFPHVKKLFSSQFSCTLQQLSKKDENKNNICYSADRDAVEASIQCFNKHIVLLLISSLEVSNLSLLQKQHHRYQ